MKKKFSIVMIFLALLLFNCTNPSSPPENPAEDPAENPAEVILSDLYPFDELKYYGSSRNDNWSNDANTFDSYLKKRTIYMWVYFGNDSTYPADKVVANREYKVVDFYDNYNFTESQKISCLVIGTDSTDSWRSVSGTLLISSNKKTVTFQDVVFRLESQEGVVDTSVIGIYTGTCSLKF